MPSTPPAPAGPAWLDAKLAAGRVVILDGAMGTELQARGVPMHPRAWSAAALFTHPEVIRAVHAEYLRAGAEVIVTNTFAAGRQLLEPAGLGARVQEALRVGVAAARAARDDADVDRPVAIAGSMCEWVHDTESVWMEPARHRAAMREQAETLAEAGVDLIAVEMAMRHDHATNAVEEALATGLPVWVGCSCRRDPASGAVQTFHDPLRPFEDVIDELVRPGVGVFHVMHSAISDTGPGLEILRARWDGTIGAYPESGTFEMPTWRFVDVVPPEELVRAARAWRELGVQVLGGCCGLGPAHVRALHEAFA